MTIYENTTIITVNTTIVAGEELSLSCEMTTAADILAKKDMKWSSGTSSSNGVIENSTSGDKTSRTSYSVLRFSPLSTVHAAEYACQTVVVIPAINVTRAITRNISLLVESKTHTEHLLLI